MRQLLRSFVMLACTLAAAPALADDAIAPRDLARALQDAAPPLVIDTRTPEEYAAGHVPGALLVPHDALDAHLARLDAARDRDIVLYCRSGRRSGLVEDQLRRLGFTRLRQLDGSWLAWDAAGLPAATGNPAPPQRPPPEHSAPKDEP